MVVCRRVHKLVALTAVLSAHLARAQDVAVKTTKQGADAKSEHFRQAGPAAIPGPLPVPYPFAGPISAPMPSLIPAPAEGPYSGPVPSPLENPTPVPIGPIPPPAPIPMPEPALPPHPECSMFEHMCHQDGRAAAFHHERNITQEECCSLCHLHHCASYTYFDSAWGLEPVCYLFESFLNAAAAGSHPDAVSGNSVADCQWLGGDCVYVSCCAGYSCFVRHMDPTCLESCPTEPPVANAHWQGQCSPTPYALCNLECDEGYSFEGTDTVLECDYNGWSMMGSLDARCVLLEPLPRNPGRS